jgi:hypothetical protein
MLKFQLGKSVSALGFEPGRESDAEMLGFVITGCNVNSCYIP